MKAKGRPQSKNIEDRRAYFGSNSVDPNYHHEDARDQFVRESLMSPYVDSGAQPIKPLSAMSLEELLRFLESQRSTQVGMEQYMGVLRPNSR